MVAYFHSVLESFGDKLIPGEMLRAILIIGVFQPFDKARHCDRRCALDGLFLKISIGGGNKIEMVTGRLIKRFKYLNLLSLNEADSLKSMTVEKFLRCWWMSMKPPPPMPVI